MPRNKEYFKNIFEESIKEEFCFHEQRTRYEYICDLFDITTYCREISEYIGKKVMDVCEAITDGTTFEYIRSDENHVWYIVVCNFPFIYPKLNWGGSIRGAWWDHGVQFKFDTCDLMVDGEQECDWCLDRDEWICFIKAVVEFSREDNNVV